MAKLKIGIDSSGAKKGASDFVQATEKMRKAGQENAAAQEDSAQKVENALADIADAARESADASSSMLDLEKLKTGIDAMDDLKDIFEKSAVALFGFSKETTDAVVLTADLAKKGAAVGESFGPMGALIGGAAGALIGYATASREAAAAAKAQAQAEREKNEQIRLGVLDVSTALHSLASSAGYDEFGLAGKSFGELTKGAGYAKLSLATVAREANTAALAYDELVKSGSASDKQLAEAKAELYVLTSHYERAKKEQAAYADAIDKANKEMEATAETTTAVAPKVEALTKKSRAHTAAVIDETDALKKLNEEVERSLNKDFGSSALDADTKFLLEKGTKNGYTGEDMIGQMQRDAVMFEEANPIGQVTDQYEELRSAQSKAIDSQKELNSLLKDAGRGAVEDFSRAFASAVFGAEVDWSGMVKSMMIDLTALIVKLTIAAGLKAFVTGFTTGGAGLGASIGTMLLGSSFHDGGTVGAGGSSRAVSPSWFAHAPRYHNGSLQGLRADEVPAILQQGEVVLSRKQVAQASSGGRPNVTFVLPDVQDVRGFDRSLSQNAGRMRRILGVS